MCKFRPGSGNFLDIEQGKLRENKEKLNKIQEIQGLYFLYSIFYIFSYYTTPPYLQSHSFLRPPPLPFLQYSRQALQATTATGCPWAGPSYGSVQHSTADRPYTVGDKGHRMSSSWPVLWLRTNKVQLTVPTGDDCHHMFSGWPVLNTVQPTVPGTSTNDFGSRSAGIGRQKQAKMKPNSNLWQSNRIEQK